MSIAESKEQFDALFQKKYNKHIQLELEFQENIEEKKRQNLIKHCSKH